jgi:hypothetical protein
MFYRHLGCLRFLPGLILVLFLGGCAIFQPLPKAELQTYREALLETRNVGDQVLQTWDKAARTARARDEMQKLQASGQDVSPFPVEFNAREVIDTEGAPDPVAVRMLALDTVVRYTNLLVTLAEGRSIAQVQSSVDQLRANLQTVTGLLSLAPVPGLAAAGPLLQTLSGALEKARLRKEFRNAVQDGESAVVAILYFLIDDTPDYYMTVFALENEKRLKLRGYITDAVGSIIKIVQDHAKPSDPAFLGKMETKIKVVLDSLVPPLQAPALVSAGSKPFSNLAQSQVITDVERMEAANRKRNDVVEGLNAYHRLLAVYVRLLDQTRSNLHRLSLALDQPVDVQAAFEETLALALQARRDIRIVRDNL